ncbi:MAG: cation:proton antiporter [Bacteroidales bacterium]|nr:cation:proton antiporter [Bacteroidales bacterium]
MNLRRDHISSILHLPVNDPVLVFAIILLVILISPVILRKFRIPGLIGLIVSGIIIGPSGFNIIEKTNAIELFATIGMLLLMFIAGLDLDQKQFRRTKYKSLLFGLLTYTIPFGLGLPVCYYLLDYNLISSLMISNMFATHTMVSYPIVTRLGLTRNEAVAVATGGTIITDTLVLLVLAVITGAASKGGGFSLYGNLFISFILFLLFVVYIIPKVARWVFHRLEDDNYSQFIFVALVVFICALLSMAAGLEPIIGAFAAGFVLNRLIPAESILRNRIDFTGNALFIPFFLISIGMIVDIRIVFAGPMAIIIAAILTTVALLGKFAASEIASRIFGFTSDQRRLLFGLTSSHAAAILAVIMVGYRIGIIDENVINGTIFLILLTCLISSVVTESAGRKIAFSINRGIKQPVDMTQETIIVSLSNPQRMERLLDLALSLKKKNHSNPLYGLFVVDDDETANERLALARSTLEHAGGKALAAGRKIETYVTIDNNVSAGIKRVAREKSATDIIVGTSGKPNLADFLFGRTLEQLITNSSQNIYVFNPVYPLNLYKKIHLFLPPHAEKENSFIHILNKIIGLAESNAMSFESHSYGLTASFIETHLKKLRSQVLCTFYSFHNENEIPEAKMMIGSDDLLVVISPHRGSISYSKSYNSLLTRILKDTGENSYLIIYPGVVSGRSRV